MSSVTAYHSMTRRLPSGVGQVRIAYPHSLFATRHSRVAERQSRLQRRHWMADTLGTRPTATRRIGLLDSERELLLKYLLHFGAPGGHMLPGLCNVLLYRLCKKTRIAK